MRLSLRHTFVPMLVLFVAYAATAKLGIALPVAEGLVSPVWVPAGIALFGLWMGGLRLWPAVFVGALVANATSGASLVMAAGIAGGNALEAVAGAWLLHRLAFACELDRIRHVAAIVVASGVSCVVAATNGATLLLANGDIESMTYWDRWLLWWFGDFMGMLVVAPLLFAVAAQLRQPRPDARRLAEFVLVNATIVVVSVVVFAGDAWRYPHVLLPLFTWATLRFRALGSTLATFLVAAIGVGYTIAGTVVVEGASATVTVQVLQGLLAIVGLSVLVIAAAMNERDAALDRSEGALRDLRELDEMKDRLLATVSHELRTPLTSILALSTMLEDRLGQIDQDKQGEMYARLSYEARRLDTLLTDLLDLERMRVGMLEPRYERVDVVALVQGVLDRYTANTLAERPTSVDLQPVEIDCDAAKLDRIVDNLVGNAYKHTPAGSHVSIRVRPMQDGALIAIDDEGDGVPAEDKQAIFEPFNRGSAALEHAPGTGIGLSLVAHFTELHGGRAWVEDRDGGGSSFRVYLPGERVGAR